MGKTDLTLDTLGLFQERLERLARDASPLLGPLTLHYWGHVHGVHFHHHYRQFNLV